jgi:hypothetical protein
MIATVENMRPKLPPTERDFEIYRRVKFECVSTRDAAGDFNLSQTRVRQIVTRVVEYLVESVPASVRDDDSSEQLYVAEQLARAQLEFLYEKAIRAWERSERPARPGEPRLGKVCYLSLATRITMCMAKVPVHLPPTLRIDEEEERAEEAERQAEEKAERAYSRLVPLNEECSARAVSSAAGTPDGRPTVAASEPAEGTYKTLDEIKAEARHTVLRPAQAETEHAETLPALVDEVEEPADEQAADEPSSESSAVRRPLNRKERRQRKRWLAKR